MHSKEIKRTNDKLGNKYITDIKITGRLFLHRENYQTLRWGGAKDPIET